MRWVGWRSGCGPPTCPPPTENRLALRWTQATAGIAPRSRRRRAAARPPPDPPPWLSRLLVRHVPRDDLVHRLSRVPDALFAHGQIDQRHALLARDLLDFLASHVAHEPGRHAVEPGERVVRPRERRCARHGRGSHRRLELRLGRSVSQPAPSLSRPTVSSI